ncbi:MAG: hypothetical protein H6818_06910 [Phycisphaerales bacterium]|nr:hypothetical protein [Phycisphaerales bacterium]
MNGIRFAGIFVVIAAACLSAANAAPIIYVAHPGRIIRFEDINNDDDYLDVFESKLYANSLPTDVGDIVAGANSLWVLDSAAARIVRLMDDNRDGDALDPGEQTDFCVVTTAAPMLSPSLEGIGLTVDDALIAADYANDVVYRIADRNHDGDAMDFAEIAIIATGLNQPIAVAPRSDGTILVLQEDPSSPLQILRDLNNDGDYLDFAENLPYAESLPMTTDMCIGSDTRTWLAHNTLGIIDLLIDANGDGDCLDPNERRRFAENLLLPTSIARDASTDGLYVVQLDSDGTIVRLRDINNDGDALDVGESVAVAAGLSPILAMAVPKQLTNCIPGDADGDGAIDTDDIPGFVNSLLEQTGPAPACPIDMNNDGRIDGLDIQPFLFALVP